MNQVNLFFFRAFLLTTCLLYSGDIIAYDFKVDGIYYNIYANNYVELTYYQKKYSSYSGDIVIPSSVTHNSVTYTVISIGSFAFYGCQGLKSITIPNSVTNISSNAFYGCSGLKSITIPNSVTTIGDYAFANCSGLKSITIPNNVTIIGSYAFENCSSLTSITIPNNVTYIYSYTFSGCSSLTSITIPNNVISIRERAFSGCSGLTSIFIPSKVTSIGDYAFEGCSRLNTISIPASMSSIGYYAFHGCNLSKINVDDCNPVYYDSRNNCNAIIKTSTNELIIGCKSTVIPNTVTSIGERAFDGCRDLTSISIPNSVTYIGEYAFKDCTGLSSITIPRSTTFIGDCAFYGCIGLLSLSITNGVTSIGSYAFSNCRKLTSIIIPGSVTSIGNYAFKGCTLLSLVKSYIENPFETKKAFYQISSSAKLEVPKGTKNLYLALSGWADYFKEIQEMDATKTTYTLSITATGNGSASYSNTIVRNTTETFTVDDGKSATILFSPDNGYRIKSVKVGTTDVTSSVSNSQYTVSCIAADTSVEIEFEAIPATTYTLSITTTGNGFATYEGTAIREETKSFTVEEGTDATITLSPDDGYRVNIRNIKGYHSSHLSENTLTLSDIRNDLTVEIEFLAIPTYTLSITASGNGSASYNNSTIRNKTSSFTVDEGSSATITFTPDDGYQIRDVKVNGSTVSISNDHYIISSIKQNTTVKVEFVEKINGFESGGINYSMVSEAEKTVYVASGSYGKVLVVPAIVSYQEESWTVTGIDVGVLSANTELAAIIWNPEAAFTEKVDNPNLLLYVKSASYASASIKNVVVNGTANSIVLSEATGKNDFYCPQEFTAKTISYTHNYKMETGLGSARGWETIALPFDVQKISHQGKGEIVPFANWKSGDAKNPFWLMTYGNNGWTEANSIKANTPYIISMPNHSNYKPEFRLSGNVTFSAENVTVPTSENLHTLNYNGRTFIPNYMNQSEKNYYALNVNNDYVTYSGNDVEGSKFFIGLRAVHPFEAYMISASQARMYISIDDDMTTGIGDITEILADEKTVRVYNLNGQLIMAEDNKRLDEIKPLLSAGMYIVNGKKIIIR